MSEPVTKDPVPRAAATSSRWPMLVLTGLLAVGVAYLLTPNEFQLLQMLDRHRAAIVAHPETRDAYAVIAYYRRLDQKLAPDARIFFSGIVDLKKQRRLSNYFFARTYLYPREVEISLDGRADYQPAGFKGVDCSSPDVLRTNGFDAMLSMGNEGEVSLLPLGEKGSLKQ